MSSGFHEATWCHDQATREVATEHQLLDAAAGHDRLSRTWVVGKQGTQWRPG
jgi:hypothetical protein